ncbi:uncharacterized protein VNE69_05263 [Vairimorpha necatrix]|uniref:Uncharacterized protein n=1 Tax=Vairimorpha necatrix TaxID=6039 RepID=A0AAX4JCH8_9MICR
MSLKLYWYFLFNHCELILFVSYNGDNQCDLYIGKTNKADELNEFKIFISRDKNLKMRLFIDSKSNDLYYKFLSLPKRSNTLYDNIVANNTQKEYITFSTLVMLDIYRIKESNVQNAINSKKKTLNEYNPINLQHLKLVCVENLLAKNNYYETILEDKNEIELKEITAYKSITSYSKEIKKREILDYHNMSNEIGNFLYIHNPLNSICIYKNKKIYKENKKNVNINDYNSVKYAGNEVLKNKQDKRSIISYNTAINEILIKPNIREYHDMFKKIKNVYLASIIHNGNFNKRYEHPIHAVFKDYIYYGHNCNYNQENTKKHIVYYNTFEFDSKTILEHKINPFENSNNNLMIENGETNTNLVKNNTMDVLNRSKDLEDNILSCEKYFSSDSESNNDNYNNRNGPSKRSNNYDELYLKCFDYDILENFKNILL